ncbi:hypothetical protein F1C16_08450 [Hymenobacter sp. NBH84]|uniref:hypothetical protein n=1 Tax=Hymenobacter sp. NBH84 TaxID=2596915 RepID=UPI0016267087|nr:hypothetical protein [Hymenobacter sp. NBH84]QNE39576.1 hypothetical protein F1C16_08450 [Hymenobacter sp. NBH84]
MIEGYIYGLGILLLFLFIVAGGLMNFVVLPWVILKAFFWSDWAPQALKNVVCWALGAILLVFFVSLGWNWHLRQEVEAERHWPPVRLTVQQPGLLAFPLGRGRIEQVHYGKEPVLVVSGDLAVEGRLRAYFTASTGSVSRNETNTVKVSTEKEDATQATGRSVYDPSSRTVSGSFSFVLPSGKRLSISFPPTPIVAHQ